MSQIPRDGSQHWPGKGTSQIHLRDALGSTWLPSMFNVYGLPVRLVNVIRFGYGILL